MDLCFLPCGETITTPALLVKHLVERIACSIFTGFWVQKYIKVHVKPLVLPLVATVKYTDNKGVKRQKYIKYTFVGGLTNKKNI